jgi:ArsR family transcriptional regulator
MDDTDFVKIAKALADPTRRRMIACLRELGAMNCSQLVENFPLSQPTISHHIKTLESAGVISIRRDGQFHILTLEEPRLAEFARQVLADPGTTKSRSTTDAKT